MKTANKKNILKEKKGQMEGLYSSYTDYTRVHK